MSLHRRPALTGRVQSRAWLATPRLPTAAGKARSCSLGPYFARHVATSLAIISPWASSTGDPGRWHTLPAKPHNGRSNRAATSVLGPAFCSKEGCRRSSFPAMPRWGKAVDPPPTQAPPRVPGGRLPSLHAPPGASLDQAGFVPCARPCTGQDRRHPIAKADACPLGAYGLSGLPGLVLPSAHECPCRRDRIQPGKLPCDGSRLTCSRLLQACRFPSPTFGGSGGWG